MGIKGAAQLNGVRVNRNDAAKWLHGQRSLNVSRRLYHNNKAFKYGGLRCHGSLVVYHNIDA